MRFTEQLAAAWQRNNSLLCVGLDPDPARLPASLTTSGGAIFSFCRAIVDATADLVCAFKPQIAYFASQRAEDQLEQLIAYIHEAYPGIPVILDAKRGDIGSTAEHYAKEAFERYRADAVTVSPYMGFDSMQPYLVHPDKGVIVLCRTSNAGGSDVQFLETNGRPVYQVVAERARDAWNTSGQMGLVVGATFPQEIRRVRENRRRHAAADPGHRRPGRRHRGHRARRPHRRRHRHDDQLVARHPVRQQRQRFRRCRPRCRAGHARPDQPVPQLTGQPGPVAARTP